MVVLLFSSIKEEEQAALPLEILPVSFKMVSNIIFAYVHNDSTSMSVISDRRNLVSSYCIYVYPWPAVLNVILHRPLRPQENICLMK